MQNLYEGMFLLDNQAVRTDWAGAKAAVTDALGKHGAEVLSARRWDERRLAYKIKGRQRGTYLLVYYSHAGEGPQRALRRDLDIDERVLRYLLLKVDAVPEGEVEKSRAELEAGFTIPPPPRDDEPPPPPPPPAVPPAREGPAEGAGEDSVRAGEPAHAEA